MENNIFRDVNYLIGIFNKNNIDISYLKANFLMFIFEAYYMYKNDVDKLYDCEYYNFNAGPIYPKLSEKLSKKYEDKYKVVLSDEEVADSEKISIDKKRILEEIYERFKNYNSDELMDFMKLKFYPGEYVDKYDIIPKICMKKWFSVYFKWN